MNTEKLAIASYNINIIKARDIGIKESFDKIQPQLVNILYKVQDPILAIEIAKIGKDFFRLINLLLQNAENSNNIIEAFTKE